MPMAVGKAWDCNPMNSRGGWKSLWSASYVSGCDLRDTARMLLLRNVLENREETAPGRWC